jgi:MFS family permease
LRGDLHLTLAATGNIATANLVGYAATTPFAAALLNRIGLRKAAFGGHAVAAVGALLMIAFAAFIPAIIGRVLTGAGSAVGLAAALRLALDAMPERRVFASITAWSGVSIGLFAAAAAQSVLFASGAWRIAVAVWGVLTLIVALTSPRAAKAHAQAPVANGPKAELHADPRIVWCIWLRLPRVCNVPCLTRKRFACVTLAESRDRIARRTRRIGTRENPSARLCVYGCDRDYRCADETSRTCRSERCSLGSALARCHRRMI